MQIPDLNLYLTLNAVAPVLNPSIDRQCMKDVKTNEYDHTLILKQVHSMVSTTIL